MKPRRRSALVLNLVATALLMLGGPPQARAQGTTVTWDGFKPADPIGSAAVELDRLVREKCFGADPAQTITFGMNRFSNDSTGLGTDQQIHVVDAMRSAFSKLRNATVAPFADVAGSIALQQEGFINRPEADAFQRALNRVQIIVNPTGARVGANFQLGLRALGRGDLACDVSVGPFPIPDSLTGEQFVELEKLFDRTVIELRNRARGANQIGVSASSVTGEPVAPNLPNYFLIEMRRAVSSTEGKGVEVIGNPTTITPVPATTPPSPNATRWNADVAVEERRAGYRITIDLSRPDGSPIANRGLVPADALPPMQRVQFTADRGPAAPARLRLRANPVRLVDTVNDRNPSRRYLFSLQTASFVEIDVPLVNGRAIPINPVIVDARGQPLAHINPPGRRVNLRRFKLEPGEYQIAVSAPSRGGHEFTLSARAAPVSEMLMLEPPGRLTRQFQDWYVGTWLDPNRNLHCYAFTSALEVSPEGWREQAPVMMMSLTNSAGGGSDLSHYLDLGERYAADQGWQVRIEAAGGEREVSVGLLGRHINPVQTGSSGKPTLDPEAIRGYTRGTGLVLEGRTPEGRPTRIAYSLIGYRSAASAMALACDRVDLARNLIWQ